MQDTITHLSKRLENTENELKNSERNNKELNTQVNNMLKEINTLKSLHLSSTINVNSPTTDNNKNKTGSCWKINTNESYLQLKQNITHLQNELQDAKSQIKSLNIQVQLLEKILEKTTITNNLLSNDGYKTEPSFADLRNRKFRKRIMIFGAQQLVGLAATLINSRKTTQYETYEIQAKTMPNAYSDRIVSSLTNTNIDIQADDKIVICLGENDHNIRLVISQLKKLLNRFTDNTFIILNVLNNDRLDVAKLNNSIKNTCKYYKNCHFAYCRYNRLYEFCKKINYIIDCEDYSKKYLNPSVIKKYIANNRPSSLTKVTTTEPKKGTIPFYFNNKYSENMRDKNANNRVMPSEKYVKGTIPYYFPIITKNKTFFRAKKCTT